MTEPSVNRQLNIRLRIYNKTRYVQYSSCKKQIEYHRHMRSEHKQSSDTVQQTRKLCRPNADILCGRPPHRHFELKIGIPVTSFLEEGVANFGFSAFFNIRVRSQYTGLIDGQTDGRTGKTRNATNKDSRTII